MSHDCEECSCSLPEPCSPPLRHVGSGSSRIAWDLGDGYILKLPRWGKHGETANLKEAEVWDRVKGTDMSYLFAEIPAYSEEGLWLIQRRCERLYSEEEETLRGEWEKVVEAIKSSGAGSADAVFKNLGRHPDGRIVIVDYSMYVFKE